MSVPSYELKESSRAKQLRITVYPDGRMVVTKPARVSAARAEAFVQTRLPWIAKTLASFERRRKKEEGMRSSLGLPALEKLPRLRRGTKAYKEAVEQARALVTERLIHFNAHYQHPYGSISIRNQKTRWGSCSASGNLSFSYKIAFLSPPIADYLIVHELCHVRQHNHSVRFWALVRETIPNYLQLRKQLRLYDLA